MIKLKSNLGKVKVWDWVLTLQWGWQKIVMVDSEDPKIWWVCACGFDENGRKRFDKFPTCFPIGQVPKPYLEIFGPPPCPFKAGDPVKVWDGTYTEVVRVFKRYVPEDVYPYKVFSSVNEKEDEYQYCERWEIPKES